MTQPSKPRANHEEFFTLKDEQTESKLLSAEAKPNPDQFWLLDARYLEQVSGEFQIDFLRTPNAEDE